MPTLMPGEIQLAEVVTDDTHFVTEADGSFLLFMQSSPGKGIAGFWDPSTGEITVGALTSLATRTKNSGPVHPGVFIVYADLAADSRAIVWDGPAGTLAESDIADFPSFDGDPLWLGTSLSGSGSIIRRNSTTGFSTDPFTFAQAIVNPAGAVTQEYTDVTAVGDLIGSFQALGRLNDHEILCGFISNATASMTGLAVIDVDSPPDPNADILMGMPVAGPGIPLSSHSFFNMGSLLHDGETVLVQWTGQLDDTLLLLDRSGGIVGTWVAPSDAALSAATMTSGGQGVAATSTYDWDTDKSTNTIYFDIFGDDTSIITWESDGGYDPDIQLAPLPGWNHFIYLRTEYDVDGNEVATYLGSSGQLIFWRNLVINPSGEQDYNKAWGASNGTVLTNVTWEV